MLFVDGSRVSTLLTNEAKKWLVAGNHGLPISKIKIDSEIRAVTGTLQGLRRDSETAPVNTK